MLTGRRDMLRTRVEELSREMRKAHKDVEAVEAEKRKLIQEETEINERLMETQHKLQQARVDRQESERDARQKEMLSELKRVFEGVYGRVLDLCKPTQRKYELAISIILGRNMDAIVVDSQKTAIACIQFLREQRSGMATFLPLDTISAKPLNERLRNVRHAHLAVDIIQFDKAYEVAMQYACGNSLVCDTIEVAKDICYKQQLNVKAVSLDGTVIHKTGMITGGQSHGDSKNARRWEEREVDNLKKAHSTLIVQQQEMAKQRRKVQGDEQLRALLTDTESRLRVANEDLTSTQRKLDATLAEIRAMESESEKLEPSLASVTKELNDLTAKVEVVDTRIKNVENEVFADFCSRIGVANIREYEEQNLKETQLVEEKRMQFATQKAKLENLLEFERDKAAQITTRIASLERTIQEDTTKLEKLQADHAAMQVSQEKLQAKLEDYQTQIEVAKLEVDERATEVAGVKKEIAKVNKEFEGVTKIIMNKESQIEELSAEKFSVFRRCKLEEIDIPLLEGSLESLSLDQLDAAQRPNPDSMDVDGEEMMGTQDSRAQIQGIEVDFSGLKRAYQDVSAIVRLIMAEANFCFRMDLRKWRLNSKNPFRISARNWREWHRICEPWIGMYNLLQICPSFLMRMYVI
ncbi:SMCs flexible hinge [Phlyctochytrium arcticum]|nr:SMCs flexible hinge [Phlyctochytrium arcticum]